LRPVGSNKEYYLDYESDLARVAFLEKKIGKKAIASPGAWGYLKTMINILEKAIKGNYHSILVLDDDFVCHKRFKTLFKEIVNHQLPDEWKIIQLGALQYDWTNDWITWFSKNLYHCNGSSVASHAVGIHESIFQPLLDFCYKFDLPFDEGSLHKVTHLYADECFVCFPNLIIQDVRETDISTSETQDSEGIKKDNVYRWNLEEYNWGPDFESCKMPGSGLEHNEAISNALKHSKSNDQLKVLHFRETFSPSSETFIYDMLWGLERFTTTDNYMVTFKRFLEDERPFPKTISLEWSDFRRGINEIKEGSNEKRRKELVTIINSINPDLIIAHFGLSAEILYKAMKPDGLTFPMVVSMHGYDVREEPIQRPEYAKIIQEILQQPNVVVTHPTYSLREQIIYNLDIQPDKLYKVNNVAKDIFYKNRKTTFWHSGETLKLINVARMVPIKGQRYLVGALAKFRREFYENTRLTIVGAANIKYEKELKDYAAELDVLRHIDFLEYLPPAEIVNLLRISDIYIQPSYQESFGMALLEAILVGLPVVATNIGGMPELIGKAPETAALIVPPKDEDAIAQALGLLFTNGALESDNFEYATERQTEFSLEQQMNSLIEAILRISPQQAYRLNYSGPK
jgi:glycosyltransferase involved in cell wall biosynthesis